MLIGIDVSKANEENKTGVEWYAYNVVQELKKLINKEDKVVLYSKNKLKGDLAILPSNFTYKVLRWPPKFLWTQIRLSFEVFFHKPDVYFSPNTIPLFPPKKTIATLYDLGFENFEQLYSLKPIGPDNKLIKLFGGFLFRILTLGKFKNNELDYHKWFVRLAIKKAAKIVTISQFSVDEIIKHFDIAKDRIFKAHCAYNKSYKIIKNTQLIKKVLTKYKINKKFIIFVGRLENKKNTPNLVKAFSIYKNKYKSDLQLVLVGLKGYGYNKVKNIIVENNLSQDVKELGWVPYEDLPFLMNGAEIFVFPSAYEGFGIPILEAMACGTPVITSNFGAMKEVANNAALLINPNNPIEISEGIHRLINDENLRQRLINKGLERVKMFSWTKTASYIKDLIYSF